MMIIHRTAEFVNYRSPLNSGQGRTPLFLRNHTEYERGLDRIEISENARKHFLDNSSSPLEKGILKALPGLERFREDLRRVESMSDERRSERIEELKSRLLMDNYHVDELMLTHAAKKMVSTIAGK